ncbi:MAG: ABC transporter ATP-binding protein, partial [Lachnospiraceae bacterium]
MLGSFRKIFAFSGTHKKALIESMVISFIGACFLALQFFALMLVLEQIITENRNPAMIGISFGIMLVSLTGGAIASYFSIIRQTETGYCMVAEKRIHIGDRMRYIPMGFFNENSLGNIAAVVTTSLADVENSAARCLVLILGGTLNTIAMALALFLVDWRIGLIVFAGIVIYLLVTELSQKQAAKVGPRRQSAQENLVTAVLEYLQGMSVIKSFGLERDGTQTIQTTIDDSCERNLKLEYGLVPWMALQQFVVRAASVAMMAAALYLYLQHTLSFPHCLLMLTASFLIYRELEGAGNMSALLQMLDASMEKADSIDHTPVMDMNGRELTAADSSISFDNVTFSYGSHKILDQVSLTIPPMTTTAIVGPSGSGKTTLCNLIARFWDVEDGSIYVGGHDVRDYTLDSLMKNISMVFQNVYLFQDTIENNIKFGKPDATHEDVIAAARAACCHEFIMTLPDGYQTVIGEGGGTLSGGEKQRISIARAILKDAPIILLDEATASIDPENEADFQQAIDALTHNKTIILIAHRLKTVRHADQILVLDQGRIIQKGTHEELVSVSGLYA